MSGAPNAKIILNGDTKDALSAAGTQIGILERFIGEPQFLGLNKGEQAKLIQPFMQADRDLQKALAEYVSTYKRNLRNVAAAIDAA